MQKKNNRWILGLFAMFSLVIGANPLYPWWITVPCLCWGAYILGVNGTLADRYQASSREAEEELLE